MEINLNQLVRDINYPWPIDVGRCYGSCVAKYHDGREKFGRHYHHIRKHYEVKPACGVKNWDNSEILFINDQVYFLFLSLSRLLKLLKV